MRFCAPFVSASLFIRVHHWKPQNKKTQAQRLVSAMYHQRTPTQLYPPKYNSRRTRSSLTRQSGDHNPSTSFPRFADISCSNTLMCSVSHLLLSFGGQRECRLRRGIRLHNPCLSQSIALFDRFSHVSCNSLHSLNATDAIIFFLAFVVFLFPPPFDVPSSNIVLCF